MFDDCNFTAGCKYNSFDSSFKEQKKKTELNASTKHLTGDIPNTTLKNTQIIHI